jgi:predicted enzyme related to lactoylglutathione lyase
MLWGQSCDAEGARTSVIKTVSFDAADAFARATFWAGVFGSDVDEDSSAGKASVEAAGWGAPNIWFTRVPEAKAAKNRIHFNLRAPGAVEDEVARLEQPGASVVRRDEHHRVMQDPEGNEFCVEPGPGARRLRHPSSACGAGHRARKSGSLVPVSVTRSR